MINRLKELVTVATELESAINKIKVISDNFDGNDLIEDILNMSDDVSLSTEQIRSLESRLEKSLTAAFDAGVKSASPDFNPARDRWDVCDDVNDVQMSVEEIIREMVCDAGRKRDKYLQELQEKIKNLQKQIDDIEVSDIDQHLSIADDMEWQALGVVRGNFQVSSEEQIRLFAPGMYNVIRDKFPSKRRADYVMPATTQAALSKVKAPRKSRKRA